MMNLNRQYGQLLSQLGQSYVSSSAYDTAWLTWLSGLDAHLSHRALNWIRRNQNDDGSWGAVQPVYYHDKLICTLSALIALSINGDERDQAAIQRAIAILPDLFDKLSLDPAGETAAFEMLVPSLLDAAKQANIVDYHIDDSLFEVMIMVRQKKLEQAPGAVVSRKTTMAHSAEMVGHDGLKLLNVAALQESNGSIGNSPAATVFYALHFEEGREAALAYLRNVALNADGGVPNVTPIDIFEHGWILWNLALANPNESLLFMIQPYLNWLESVWIPGQGVGYASTSTVKDGDDTGLVFEVLSRFGRQPDLDAVLAYEDENYFRCFDLESNASISTNIHILGALAAAGLPADHPAVAKVLYFLQNGRAEERFWIDKWHSSPYYATGHAIIAAAPYNCQMTHEAVDWLLNTQQSDGSWGFYGPTTEETAYALQALLIWEQHGHYVSDTALQKGAKWLQNHRNDPYPPLWIGKCLYTPELVVRSAILSALMMFEKYSQNRMPYKPEAIASD